MNQILVACFCVVAAFVLLIYSIWLSANDAPSRVWGALLLGLALFLIGMLALRGQAEG